ncbi:unnamed protein product, partial [Didymodactylos carnosus]
VLFGTTQSFNKSYVIYDLHGTIDEQLNLHLIQTIQLYATIQIIYLSEQDLSTDFLDKILKISPEKPTIIVLFDINYDDELATTKLIQRFQHHYVQYQQWTNVKWTSVPILNSPKSINKFNAERRNKRLRSTFENLFTEMEVTIQQQ